jgi:hypothetical protein
MAALGFQAISIPKASELIVFSNVRYLLTFSLFKDLLSFFLCSQDQLVILDEGNGMRWLRDSFA